MHNTVIVLRSIKETIQSSENCALLGHYVASSGNFLRTFRDNISVPSSGFKH
jgi:hypothetical protein